MSTNKQDGFILVTLLLLVVVGVVIYLLVFKSNLIDFTKIKILPQQVTNLLENGKSSVINNTSSKIENSVIYFSSSDKVVSKYVFSTKTIEKVVDAESYAISNDGQWLAYTSGYDTAQNMVIYIKNLKDGQISSFDSKTELIRRLQWSSSAQYLVSDSGTGPEGMMVIFDRSGKHIASFGTAALVWANDDSMLFYSLGQKVDPIRPYESGLGNGVGLMELPSGKTQVVLSPDATTDYSPVSYEDGNLTISRRQVVTPSDWSDNQKITESYLTIDSAHLQSSPKATSAPVSVSKDAEIRKEVLALGILDLATIPDYNWSTTLNPLDSNWVLVSIYPGSNVYSSDLYVLNLQQPKESLVHIGKGAWPQWR